MLDDDRKIELEALGGILVYGDSALPEVYYYSSTRPAIAQVGDQAQVSLLAYQNPSAENAGMLSFVVDLKPNPEDLEAFKASYPQAQMLPMPWTSGSVTVAIAGADPVFATPSLVGDNSAVVSLALTLDQYQLLKKSKVAPISVVYALAFEALRDAYAFRIEFDQDKFRKWIQQKLSVQFLFLSLDKIETFEEIREAGVIRVLSINQTGEDPPEGFRRAFLQSLQSILTPMPCFAPPPEGGEVGWGIGFEVSTVRDIQDLQKRLDTDMSVVAAVTRKAYLQGLPQGLSEALAACPVIELPTASHFVQRLSARCENPCNQKPLQALQVRIDSGVAAVQGHVFDQTRLAPWELELTHNPCADIPYTYRCDLHFRDGIPSIAGQPITIARNWAFLDLVPESYYQFRNYQILAASDYPWSLFKTTTLTLTGPEAFSFGPPVQLRAEQTSGAISAFAPLPSNLEELAFRLVCEPVSGPSFELTGLPSGRTIYLNMFRKRSIQFRVPADFDWSSCDLIRVTPDNPPGAPLLASTSAALRLTQKSPSASFSCWTAGSESIGYRVDFALAGKAIATATLASTEKSVAISYPDLPVKSQTRTYMRQKP